MNIPQDYRYTSSHEWVQVEGGVAVIGITDYAQSQLSDLTYLELPSEGDEFNAGEEVAVLESVKAASDVYAPVSGVVVEVNDLLNDSPELVNTSPFGDGWLFKLKMKDPDELKDLLDSDEYEDILPD